MNVRWAVLVATVLALATAAAEPARAEDWIMLVPGDAAAASGAEPAVRLAIKDIAGAPELRVALKPGADAARGFKAALRKGEAHLAEIPLSVLARESALYAADQIPYLATSTADAERLFQTLAPVIARRLSEEDLVLLALRPQPARGLLSKRAVVAVSDLAKQAVWASSGATRRLAEQLGGTPVADVKSANVLFVTAGEAAALLPSAASGAASQWTFHEAAGWHAAHAIVVSAKAWQALPPETAQAILDRLRDGERAAWSGLDATAKSDAARLAAAGYTVAPLPPDVSAELARVGRRMADEWMPGAGADGADWLAKVGEAK